MKTYQQLASSIRARLNCIAHNNEEWKCKHAEIALQLVEETAPSGSGIDCGTKLSLDESTGEKLVFNVAFHHMDENGYYDGWTEHQVIVTPSLQFGFNLRITGQDRNDIKDFLSDVYHEWLNTELVTARFHH